MKALIAALLASIAIPAFAQGTPPVTPAPVPAPAPRTPPKLIVAISVDQFSADLFAQYRNHFTGGLARLLQGAVFPSGYQSHAATETCPGHSTILTGMRPAHTGIVANTWIDQSVTRADKAVYCAEDETKSVDHDHYLVSDQHLKVPTLGEMMKRATPATRIVSVAGKDRAAVMMGGHRESVDQIWWWQDQKDNPVKTFVTYPGRPEPAVVARTRKAVDDLIAAPQTPLPLPGYCATQGRSVQAGTETIGEGRFARDAGDTRNFKLSPAADAAVFALAAGLIQELKLGQQTQTDLIAIGASATDYIGHAYGTQGTEMCIQMSELDRTLDDFFHTLDSWGIDYEVVLTADHGGHDATERQQQRAMPMEERVDASVSVEAIGAAVGKELGIAGKVLIAAEGDVYVADDVPHAKRAAVIANAVGRYRAMPQVAAVLTRAEIAATPMPTGLPPETWTLAQRARASFDATRSGDFLILLKPRITGIPVARQGYVATHGSPWDYDRRVPILFWRKGMAGFEQPLSVETVDIAPTLAATIGLRPTGLDGRCLDLDSGPADTCRP